MNTYTFHLVYPSHKQGYNNVHECKVAAFNYEVALQRALVEAHHFAIENNIPYYRVEG
jgi:hypothetical protein